MADVLHTTDASVGEVIEPAAVQELPLNGRMLIDLVLTVPGAHVSHGAQTGDMNPLLLAPGQRSPSASAATAQRQLFPPRRHHRHRPTFNTLNLSPSPDAVQEFKVQRAATPRKWAAPAAARSTSSPAAAQSIPRTAYEFLRNGAMDAHTFGDMAAPSFLSKIILRVPRRPIAHTKTFSCQLRGLAIPKPTR